MKSEYMTQETRRNLPWILLRAICFMLCFAVLLAGTSSILARKSLLLPWNMSLKVGGFYNEPENSMDTIFFGSSHMYCSVDPVELKTLTGHTSYILATQEQPVWLSYYYIKEALKTQRPDTIVFEVNMVTADQEFAEDGANYSAMDPIRFSKNRIDMAAAAAPWGERRMLLFNIFKYHGRWEEVDREDLMRDYQKKTDPERGYVKLEMVSPQAIDLNATAAQDAGKLLPKVNDYLNRIIDLAEEEDIRLIFMKSPSNPSREDQMSYNAAFQLAEQRGIYWLDCNQYYEEIGIDPETDFFDEHHLNVNGVKKLTSFLAQKLYSSAKSAGGGGESASVANRTQI